MDAQSWQAWRRERSSEAFRALAEPVMPFAYDLARRMGCSGPDADDAVQECLIQLAREESDEPVRVGLRAWVGRRVRFGVSKQRRGRSRRRNRERAAARPESVPEDASSERRDEVEAALARLPAEDRQLVLLRFHHDLDHREIAYVLNISPNACRIRVHRAVSRLRRSLGPRATLLVATLALHRAAHAEAAVFSAVSSKAAAGALLMSTGTKMAATGLAASTLTALTLFATGVASFGDPPVQRFFDREGVHATSGVDPGDRVQEKPRAVDDGAEAKPFQPGTCTLRIGDRFRFGDDAVGAAEPDLVCYDIRRGAVLATPSGSQLASMPLLGGRPAPSADAVFSGLDSAPPEVTGERVRLGLVPRQDDSCVALVQGRDGLSYKLQITSVQEDPNARRRRVTLRYRSVDASEGGGAVLLPDAVAAKKLPEGWSDTIKKLATVPPAFRETLKWVRVKDVSLVSDLPHKFSIGTERQVALDRPLVGEFSIVGPNMFSSRNPLGPALVYASRGTAPESMLTAGSWAVLLVDGDLEGELETRTFSFVRVTGNVVGKLELRSQSHVIVDGSILGELECRGSAHVLLRGPVTKPEAIRVRSSATLYCAEPVTRTQIERLRISFRATIHLQHSDLGPGEHRLGRVNVIVADPIWNDLR